VRKVLSDGTIRTVAGNGSLGFSGDGGPAKLARITPTAVAATPDGGFLIADSAADRVRYVSPGGVISTVAGSGADTSAGDGGLATHAGVNGPRGLAVRPDGRFLIAEYDGDRVRFADLTPPLDPVAKGPPRRTGAGNRKPTDRRQPTTANGLTLRIRSRMRARPRRPFRVRYWASAEANVTLKVFKKSKRVRRVRRHARAGRNRIKMRRGLRAGRYVLRLSARGPDRKVVRVRARLIVRRR
jgi:DNA-binding beta-propeller fold protein YncE